MRRWVSKRWISTQTILKRITGVSTPFGGISFNPSVSEAEIAKKLLTFLEDRRVLYIQRTYPRGVLEVPLFAIKSVLEIRTRLTEDLEMLDRSSSLAASIVSMRAACRKFLDRTQSLSESNRPIGFGPFPNEFSTEDLGQMPILRLPSGKFLEWIDVPCDPFWLAIDRDIAFLTALGEMRGVFGIHIAEIAAKYCLNVEDGLASIIPAPPDKD